MGRWHHRVAGLADGLAGNRRHGGDLAALGTGEPPAIGVFTATAKIFIHLYLYIYNVVIKSSEGMWLLVKMIQSLKVWGHSEKFTFEDKYYFPPPCMVEKVTKCASLLRDFCAQVWD